MDKIESIESLFVAFMNLAALLFMWMIPAFFIAFACNGGAAGSSQLTGFAWGCVGIYTLIFFLIAGLLRSNINDTPCDDECSNESLECDKPIERDNDFIKLKQSSVDFSDPYNAKTLILIVIVVMIPIIYLFF
ncbi:MAG: hypothetical protein GQ569_09625 [Methylococcaceae bacterium]|nr:hypothetical protein [Methylococcaceae bacterium]